MDGRAEEIVRLQKRREGEEDEHDAGGPVEDLEREGGRERWAREWFCLAEDEATDEGDAGGECEEERGVDDAVLKRLMRLKEEMRVFEGEEDGVEDYEEGEKAEQEGYGFGEFEQHAPAPLGGISLAVGGLNGVVELSGGQQVSPLRSSR